MTPQQFAARLAERARQPSAGAQGDGDHEYLFEYEAYRLDGALDLGAFSMRLTAPGVSAMTAALAALEEKVHQSIGPLCGGIVRVVWTRIERVDRVLTDHP